MGNFHYSIFQITYAFFCISLLFIPPSTFICLLEFSISDCVFCILYSMLLKISLCFFWLFSLIQLTFSVTNILISLSSQLFISFLLFIFFHGLSLALSTESSSSEFSFCLTFSVSLNVGAIVISCSLEGCRNIFVLTECSQDFWWKRWI